MRGRAAEPRAARLSFPRREPPGVHRLEEALDDALGRERIGHRVTVSAVGRAARISPENRWRAELRRKLSGGLGSPCRRAARQPSQPRSSIRSIRRARTFSRSKRATSLVNSTGQPSTTMARVFDVGCFDSSRTLPLGSAPTTRRSAMPRARWCRQPMLRSSTAAPRSSPIRSVAGARFRSKACASA